MSETEPKYYTKEEVNRMLEVVEQQKWNLFKDYGKLLQRISELETENKELKMMNALLKNSLAEMKDRNQNLRGVLVDTLKGIDHG